MISLVRTSTGSIGIQYSGSTNADAGIGSVSGSGVLLFGVTDADEKGKVQNSYIFEQPDEDGALELTAGKKSANIQANGYNMYLDMNAGYAAMNVEMNTVNSVYDRRFTMGSDTVVMGQGSANNLVQVGGGADMYVDQGVYNVATASEGNKTWITTETSQYSMIIGSEKGQNTYMLNGQHGTAVGMGMSNNYFVVGDNASNTTIVGSAGINQLIDNAGRTVVDPSNPTDGGSRTTSASTAGHTLFIGGTGVNIIESNGTNSLYDLRLSSYNEVVFKGAHGSYAFGSDEEGGINIYDVYSGAVGNQGISNWATSYYPGTFAAQFAANILDPLLTTVSQKPAES